MYYRRRGVPQDYAEAFRRAAEQGHTRAEYKLGSMYDNGLGVSHDHAAGARWYRRPYGVPATSQ
jgi:TPR repeat protein